MREVEVSVDIARRALRAQSLFADISSELLDDLVGQVVFVSVEAGEVLIREGEVGESAYVVVTGRFDIEIPDHTGGDRIRESGKGELLGELALLTDDPRSATVVAARDSLVVRLDRDVFDAFTERHPEIHRHITGSLIGRLRRAETGPSDRAAVITVVMDGGPATSTFVAELREAIVRRRRSAVFVGGVNGRHDLGGVDLGELEATHDLVVLVPSPGYVSEVGSAARQCDRVLHVVDADGRPSGVRAPGAHVELVLVHPAGRKLPFGTSRWLAHFEPDAHRHIRAGDHADHDRLLRHLLEEEYVLVLGGGGARGLAHVGVYRALLEVGIPIDVVSGVSSGAIMGAGIACGWSVDRLRTEVDDFMIAPGSPVDTTLPVVALSTGAELTKRARGAFDRGGIEIEDLWLPFECLSANLTTADVQVHRTGLLWRAIRATVAIPGVFPPLAEPEGLLVDGGIIDNLPVARARGSYPGATVIASDVSQRDELPPDGFPSDGVISGWSALVARVGSRRSRRPGLVSLLTRLATLGGVGISQEEGDVHMVHDLPGIGRFDFDQGDAIIDAGYQTACAVLAEADLP